MIRRLIVQPVIFILIICSHYVNAQPQEKIVDEVSYTNDIRLILNNFCTTCHAGDDPQGELVLTSYEIVQKHTKNGELLKRINDKEDPMPPNGLIPEHMRRIFKLWAKQGYINQGKAKQSRKPKQIKEFNPKKVVPIDINQRGFEMLGYLQGHWIGSMNLMGQKLEWMAFDFRPIAPSHIHGIFEGGTIGNLFTSFFITRFNGKKTIMARNGGILNGIYRTSYFVLDEVKYGRDWGYYRLVDARGGKDIMYMELTFQGNSIEFNAYTSRFGLTEPKPHMNFTGKRMHPELADQAAKKLGFPKNVIDYDFSKGLPKPTWADKFPFTSASYIREINDKNPDESIVDMGKLAKDPRRIDQIPYLSKLKLSVQRSDATRGKKLLIYLSRDALVDSRGYFITKFGYIREELLDTILLFPELGKNQSQFTFTYLHPGDYYLSVIADIDGDGLPSTGDITHPVGRVNVKPNSTQSLSINDLSIKN